MIGSHLDFSVLKPQKEGIEKLLIAIKVAAFLRIVIRVRKGSYTCSMCLLLSSYCKKLFRPM